MKTLLLASIIGIPVFSSAQPANASNFLEGGKTLIELIKVIKPQRSSSGAATYQSPDSCSIKKISDISFRNKLKKAIIVNLYFRTGNSYEQQPLLLRITPSSQESLYELRTGIYRYRVETDDGGQRTLLQEGELRLAPCEKAVKDIKD